MSIGGNDVGFVDLILSCFSSWDELLCRSTVAGVDRRIDAQLPARLDATYADIRTRAPGAKVIVVGYPTPLGCLGLVRQASGVNSREAALLDGVAAHLDRVLAQRAAAARVHLPRPGAGVHRSRRAARHAVRLGQEDRPARHLPPDPAGHRDGFAPLVRAAMG